ncbi:hypothetical protein EXS65_03400, partial [Candidatus Peribacteria bacterium]|nr:hypothetical protein [Candidatus Peribacteria bacterium]
MLRRFHIAHFALEHSPEKEQRLLFVDPQDDHGNGIGGMESNETSETHGHVQDNDPVDAIRNRIEGRVRSVDPKILISELSQNGNATLKILDGANALENEREELKIGDGATKPEQASDAVTALFNDNLPLERILSTVGAIRQKVDEYESRTSEVEHNIRRSFGFEADTNELNNMLGRFSDYENKNNGIGIVESINNKLIHEDNICDILKIRGSHTLENRQSFVGILENMARANRLRRAFGQDAEPKDDKARTEARNKFLKELNSAADTIAEYLDARINQRASALLEKSTTLSKRFHVDDALSRYGITKDGIGDAFDDNAMSLAHIRRDIADGRKPIKNDRNLTEAEGAISRLKEIEKGMEMQQIENGDALPVLLLEKRTEELNAIDWVQRTANRLAALNIPELIARSPAAEERIYQLVEMVRPFADGNTPTTEDIIDMRQTTVSEQHNITEFIRNIEQNPYALDTEMLEQADMEIPENQIDAVIAETKQRIETVVPDILAKID